MELLSALPDYRWEEFVERKTTVQPNFNPAMTAAPTPEVKHIITSVGSLSDLILDKR